MMKKNLNKVVQPLSVAQRLKAYQRAYKLIGTREIEFMCRAVGHRNWTNDDYMFDNFPELVLCGPYRFTDAEDFGSSGGWFLKDGYEARLTILAFCIAMCK